MPVSALQDTLVHFGGAMKPISAVILAVAFLACGHYALMTYAANSSAVVKVSATVLPWVKLNASQHVTHYTVTADNMTRGYVDLPGAATVRVRSNENRTIGVTLLNEGPERILIKASGTPDYPVAGEAVVIGRPQRGAEIARDLDLRVILPEGTREGTYTLNISLNPYTY